MWAMHRHGYPVFLRNDGWTVCLFKSHNIALRWDQQMIRADLSGPQKHYKPYPNPSPTHQQWLASNTLEYHR